MNVDWAILALCFEVKLKTNWIISRYIFYIQSICDKAVCCMKYLGELSIEFINCALSHLFLNQLYIRFIFSYFLLIRITSRGNLAVFVCMNAYNSVSIKARDTKFGLLVNVYHTYVQLIRNTVCHAQYPSKLVF